MARLLRSCRVESEDIEKATAKCRWQTKMRRIFVAPYRTRDTGALSTIRCQSGPRISLLNLDGDMSFANAMSKVERSWSFWSFFLLDCAIR